MVYQNLSDKSYLTYGLDRFIKYGKSKETFLGLDSYFSNTTLLLYDSLTDLSSSSRTVTQLDSIDLSSLKKVGLTSLRFDNRRAEISNFTGLDFASDDFTIESWFLPTSLPANGTVFELGEGSTSIRLQPQAATTLGIVCTGTSFNVSYSFSTGMWYHMVYQRRAGVFEVYVNGSLVRSFTRTFAITGKSLGIGYARSSTTQRMIGSLNAFRVTKGIGRYSGSFNPTMLGYGTFISRPFGLQDASRLSYLYYSLRSYTPAIWYDAADSQSVILVDQQVSTWYDKSGNGNHATQITSSSRGLYNWYSQNNLPTVSFRGTSKGMTTPITISSTPYTIIIVCKQATTLNSRVVQSGSINALMAPARSSNAFFVNGSNVRSAPIVGVNTWCMVTMIIGSGTSQVWYNGTNYGSGTHGAWGSFRIGAIGTFNEDPQAEIAEIIVFTRAITTEERLKLELYIKDKWNI